ncbi:MAG: hypothetical protein ACMUIE_07100 [Thermoplasmatota archaeon]
MSTKGPYGMEKDLKVLKGRSERHSARLEGQFLGLLPSSDIPSAEGERRHVEKGYIVRSVRDPLIKIDLKVADLEKDRGPFKEMLNMLGLDPREGDFEVLSTMDKVLRALAKARFKNLAELKLDGELVYDHPEIEWDLRDVLKKLKELSDKENLEEAEALVILREEGDTQARIKVDKVHTELGHDITIKIDGELEGEMLRRIINYLEEHLEVQELVQG